LNPNLLLLRRHLFCTRNISTTILQIFSRESSKNAYLLRACYFLLSFSA
jgi:hypothetical protein